MTGKPKIVVLGGINIDLIALAPRVPGPGETVVGDDFYTTPGGKGGNQAVAAARLGAEVSMIGRVGGDIFGPGLLDDLRKDGVDVSGVAVDPDRSSGVAFILLDSDRQNRIVAVYGANAACDDEQLRAAHLAMDGADTLLLQQETDVELSLAAAEYARANGVRVVWDPAPVRDVAVEAYRNVDVLTPNQTEVKALCGIDVIDVDSAQRAAGTLVEMGIPTAIVKLGEQGACYATKTRSGHVPSFEVEPVDTVGAGDAFGAGLAVALGEGASLEEAVRFGCATGALSVTTAGAQAAMPYRAQVEALLNLSRPGDGS